MVRRLNHVLDGEPTSLDVRTSAVAQRNDAALVRRAARCLLFIAAPTCCVMLMQALILAFLRNAGSFGRSDAFLALLLVDQQLVNASLLAMALTVCISAFIVHRDNSLFDSLPRWISSHPVSLAVVAVLALAAASVVVYRQHPLSMDEFAPLFQATAFSRGSLTGEIPPGLVERAFGPGSLGFFFTASTRTGEVVSNYWPGHALLLTPFVWIGAPWLLNPILSGFALVLVARVAKQLSSSPEVPGWAVLFTVASPAFIVSGISFYSMQAHLTANLLFTWLLLRGTRNSLFAAGVAGSFAVVLHNPYAHPLYAAPWFIWRAIRGGWKDVAALAAGYLPLLMAVGLGWVLVRQQIAEPYSTSMDGTMPAHSLAALFAANFTLPSVGLLVVRLLEFAKIWIWAVPGLPALALLAWIRRRGRPELLVLAGSTMLSLVGYLFFVYSQGHGWGSRYFHPAWLVLPLAAAVYVESGAAVDRAVKRRVAGPAAVLSLILLNAGALAQIRFYMDAHLSQMPQTAGEATPVVILVDPTTGHYTSDLIQNDPMLLKLPILLQARGVIEDSLFMATHFPELRRIVSSWSGSVWAESN